MRMVRWTCYASLYRMRKMDLRLPHLPREIGCLHARIQAMIF